MLRILKKALAITLGAILFAFGLEGVLLPNNIMDGGIVGISILLAHLTHWNLALFIFFINIPFIFLGYKQIGKTFAFCSLYGIIVLALSTALLHNIDPFTTDPLLATIFGGIMIGAGIGLAIRSGGALDGTEVLAIWLNPKMPFSVAEIVLGINVIIFSVAAFVLGLETALYSMVVYFIAAKCIDIVLEGLDENKQVIIISDKAEQISEAITSGLGRGVTFLNGSGAFTGDDKKIILCVITRIEESKLVEIVKETDMSAFVTVSVVAEVHGGRFKKKNIH